MLYLIKLFPEITIKSRPVRRRQSRQLRKNIRAALTVIDDRISVTGEWDSIEVTAPASDPALLARIPEQLAAIPGISLFHRVEKYPLPDLEGILALAHRHFAARLRGCTFCVRCKRTGHHDFNSVDVERYVGAGLLRLTESAGVSLSAPEVTVTLEIRQDKLYVLLESHAGLGGFPLGCQDSVLSLISGGYDSAVASYQCIRRGLQTHYCFFNLGSSAHEIAVREVALYLWMKFHASHRVRFISVPFEAVVREILQQIDNPHMGVVLKRMMLRAASRIAEDLEIKALVTGDSVAQVSSQTLANLSVVDAVSDTVVLRPLITSDKQEIIDLARQIGSEKFSRTVPEYCAMISRNPVTGARPERVAREEARFNMDLLDQAVANARSELITDLIGVGAESPRRVEDPVEIVGVAEPGALVIDIRHPNEVDVAPMEPGALGKAGDVLAIPFYELRSSLDQCPRHSRVLLYCARGMMSRLHAAYLRDQGFTNVAVLDP